MHLVCRNVNRAEEAAHKFKEVQEAFEVLSDPARRQELDGFEERGCNVCLIFSSLFRPDHSRTILSILDMDSMYSDV